jgi:hypothetical protein
MIFMPVAHIQLSHPCRIHLHRCASAPAPAPAASCSLLLLLPLLPLLPLPLLLLSLLLLGLLLILGNEPEGCKCDRCQNYQHSLHGGPHNWFGFTSRMYPMMAGFGSFGGELQTGGWLYLTLAGR